MTSKARQKIDPTVRDMFDPEVDRPDHDQLLVSLFDDDLLVSLLMDLHQAKPLKQFTPESRFRLREGFGNTSSVISYEKAVELTGVKPRWSTTSAIRLEGKRLEVPLEYSSNGRFGRIVGFADVAVAYTVMGWPQVYEDGTKHTWGASEAQWCAVIEVKSAWPTVGNLVRQLQLYRYSTPVGLTERQRLNVVVGPDSSVSDILSEHGYRMVTFKAGGTEFEVVPAAPKVAVERQHGEF
jgi:hypothetical protein